ncbi:DUF4129 domain-containing transglutaminase family protein [Chloroflexota bacterium]
MNLELRSRADWLGHFPRGVLHLLWQRLKPLYRLLLPNQGWVTFLLLSMVVLSVTWSVMSARWTEVPQLPSIALAGLVTGLALAKIRFHGLVLQGVALVMGSLAVLWFGVQFVEADTWGIGVRELGKRLGLWFDAAVTDGVSTDSLPFAAALVAATWLLGYLCAWFTFRHRNIWVPLILAGIGILTNLSYLPSRHWPFLFMFLLFAMLTLAWMSIVGRRWVWNRQRIQHSPSLGLFGLYDAFLFSVVVVIVAAILPTGIPRPPLLKRGYEYLRWPVEEFRGDFNRLFAGIPARKPYQFRIFDNTLPFHGAIRLGDEVVFTLKSSQPSYWRVRSYPTYTSQGWVAGATQAVPLDWQPEAATSVTYQSRERVVQRVELNFSPRLLMAAGIAQESDIGVNVEIPVPPAHTISLVDPLLDASLPDDVQALADTLRRMAEEKEPPEAGLNGTSRPVSVAWVRPLSEADILDALPEDLELVGVEADETGAPVSVTVKRRVPVPLDILSVRSQKRLFSSDEYSVTSSVSVATPQELREAGEEYPGWVRDLYLQLPDTLPERVVDLARDVAAEAETPYDKALAIRDYLHTLPYRLDIPPPAFDADGVDHFLFNVGAGYSDYFASAMAVMLRAVGIPTRMAVGYSYGETDEQGNGVVRDRNSHGWTEVFFPDYGWVEFEPTPGRERLHMASAPERLFLGEEDFEDEFLDDDDIFPWGPGPRVPRPPDGGFALPGMPWMLLVAGLIGLAFLSVLGFRWLLGSPTTVLGVYVKMARLSALAGLGPHDGQTPREYGSNLAQRLPGIAPEVEAVLSTYVKRRYGNQVPSESEQASVLESWRAMRRTLFVRALRHKRW